MTKEGNITYSCVFSLESIGIILGIVLCILQGVGTIDIGWFWATFPFWAPLALDIAILILVIIIAVLIGAIKGAVEKRRANKRL